MQYLSTNRAARRVQARARAGAVTSNRSRRMKMKTNKIRSCKCANPVKGTNVYGQWYCKKCKYPVTRPAN